MKKARIIFILFGLLFILAAAFFLIYAEDAKEDKEYTVWRGEFEELKPSGDMAYLSDCLKVNDRTVAWLTIPDTLIDFPIVRADDNEYYLNHNFKNEVSMLGNPFLDYRCSGDFSDFNSVIYGHHISRGRIFSGLEDFLDEEFFDAHETGILTTPERIYTIHFVASLNIDSRGFVYDVVFLTENDRLGFLENVLAQALCLRPFSAEELKDERLVSLSTCSYQFEDARTVLVGYLR